MNKTVIEIEGDFIKTIMFDHALTTVIIHDLETGLRAKAHAKWHETDAYDPAIGETLAYSRALRRFETKFEKYVIKNLVQEAPVF